MATGWSDVMELNSEVGILLCRGLEQVVIVLCIKTEFELSDLRAFLIIRSDSSRNKNSSRFR